MTAFFYQTGFPPVRIDIFMGTQEEKMLTPNKALFIWTVALIVVVGLLPFTKLWLLVFLASYQSWCIFGNRVAGWNQLANNYIFLKSG